MSTRALILAAAAWLTPALAGITVATAAAAPPGGGAGVQGPLGPPAVVVASDATLIGTADPAAQVAVYTVAPDGSQGTALGSTIADATGLWRLGALVISGQRVAATQTAVGATVSALSPAMPVVGSTAAPPPTATITGPAGATSADGEVPSATPAFTLAASDPDAVTLCRIDATVYAPCAGAYQPPVQSQGPHTLYLRAADAEGLSGEVAQPFDVDVAPVGKITSGPARFGHQSSTSFRFSVPAGTTATACALDNGSYRRCSTSFATGYQLDGRHVFHLRTTDTSGEVAVLDTVFTIDTLKPGITVGSARITVDDSGAAGVAVTCPASEPGGCSGTLTLATVPAKHSKARARTIISLGWKAGPTVKQQVSAPVPGWALSGALQKNGIATKLTVIAHDNAGNTTTVSRGGRLRASASAVWRDPSRRAARAARSSPRPSLYSVKY